MVHSGFDEDDEYDGYETCDSDVPIEPVRHISEFFSSAGNSIPQEVIIASILDQGWTRLPGTNYFLMPPEMGTEMDKTRYPEETTANTQPNIPSSEISEKNETLRPIPPSSTDEVDLDFEAAIIASLQETRSIPSTTSASVCVEDEVENELKQALAMSVKTNNVFLLEKQKREEREEEDLRKAIAASQDSVDPKVIAEFATLARFEKKE